MITKTTPHSLISRLSSLSSTENVQDLLKSAEGQQSSTECAKNVQPKSPFSTFENLCSASKGATVLFATDEWFASADNLLEDGPPIFIDDLYCEHGKVMDGWESRRRREAGHDWCIIKLAQRAELLGVEIDTAHFTGNNAPMISLELADLSCREENVMVAKLPGVLDRLLQGGRQGVGHTPDQVREAQEACEQVVWNELLPQTPLKPGYEPSRMHYFTLPSTVTGTHIRVNYYPDGGVARLRLWGVSAEAPVPPPTPLYLPIQTGRICTVVPHSSTPSPPSQQRYDFPELSSEKRGGTGVGCSNQHYGTPANLILASLGKDMGDGWETARHPDRPSVLIRDPETQLVDSPLKDWAVIKLGSMAPDGIARILLDTRHFRGNYPESVCVEGCFAERGMTDDHVLEHGNWFVLVPRTRMAPDSEHLFDRNLQQIENSTRAVTHVRVSIFPDGGLSRVRIYGKPSDDDENNMRSNL